MSTGKWIVQSFLENPKNRVLNLQLLSVVFGNLIHAFPHRSLAISLIKAIKKYGFNDY